MPTVNDLHETLRDSSSRRAIEHQDTGSGLKSLQASFVG